jgi:hypothetical protein
VSAAPERRLPGWVVLAVIVVLVAAVGIVILLGAGR